MADDRWARLTARERETAELARSGLGNKEIAFRRGVSVQTVKNQLHTICIKVGLARGFGRRDLQFDEVSPPAELAILSRRQLAACDMFARGMRPKDVAREMNVERAAVYKFRKLAQQKLGLGRTDMLDLVRRVRGIVET